MLGRQGKRLFDFRSDTVTLPTQRMMNAMMKAQLGDDVYNEDKSTIELEKFTADLCGYEAALFCVSGTMSNQLAFRTWLQQGPQSVLLDARSHVYKYENQGIAHHCGAGVTAVSPTSNHLTWERIKANLIHDDIHCAVTKVISLENTLQGSVFPFEEIERIRQNSKLILHCDGARLWNASTATGTSMKQYGQLFDSMSVCLSKGIGAPVGSVLLGQRDFIAKARHYRKLFGGGWRQSGVLAAAAQQAIQEVYLEKQNGVSLMQQDHMNAIWLAEQLTSKYPGLKIVNNVETNMVFLNVRNLIEKEEINVQQFVYRINEPRLMLATFGYNYDVKGQGATQDDDYVIRLVLHHQTPREACELLVNSIGLISK